MSATQTIDDSDPSVVYSPNNWEHESSYIGAVDNTVSDTSQDGATAKLTFYGTKIQVYGCLTSTGKPVQTSYRVDNLPETIFNAPDVPSYPKGYQLFYDSPILPLGHHTLLIANKRDEGILYLDYFLVSVPSPGVTAAAIVSSPSASPGLTSTVASEGSTSAVSSSLPSASGTAFLSSDTSSDTPRATHTQRYSILPEQQSYTVTVTMPTDTPGSPSSDIQAAPSHSKATLIGGILGGLLFLLLTIGFAVFLWKRRRNYRMAPSSMFRGQYSDKLPDDQLPFNRY